MKRLTCLAGLLLVLSVTVAAQERITEDDPRWDCRTMGNKICGGDGGVVRDIREHQGHIDATLVSGSNRVALSEFASIEQLQTWARKFGYSTETTQAKKPAIYCGAPTKKGTPCKRRVKKAGDHCYLHGGGK